MFPRNKIREQDIIEDRTDGGVTEDTCLGRSITGAHASLERSARNHQIQIAPQMMMIVAAANSEREI